MAIRHVAFEDLGVWEPEIRAHGYSITYLDAGVDDIAPFASANLGVVLGGPIGVEDIERYPVLTEEMELIAQRLDRDAPTIGVCLGAQLIAASAGAEVYPGALEIGWAPVALTEAGKAGPMRHLADVPMLHWHADTFDMPLGATLLASTQAVPHQAFQLGNAWGVQFHPEVDGSEIERWLIGHSAELFQAGMDVADLRAASKDAAAPAAMAGVATVREIVRSFA